MAYMYYWISGYLISLFPVALFRKFFRKNHVDSVNSRSDKPRQLLVDISVIINSDARTGVQRLVRGVLNQLLLNPPDGFQVRPIYATRKQGYRYDASFFGEGRGHATLDDSSNYININRGDVFLGLDLTAHLLPKHQLQLLRWQQQGVFFHIVIYDLLPLLHPEWFNSKTTRNFKRWIKSVAILADGAICISKSTQADFTNWMEREFNLVSGMIKVNTIPLGMDIEATRPSQGYPEGIDQLLSIFGENKTVLMVGTVEPRKGYAQALSAFELLWQNNKNINLVIVGKPGWKTEVLQRKLRVHQECGKHLWWFESASDQFLERLYGVVDGVLIASLGEGFGLPIVEALRHKRAILVRDIPVLREVSGINIGVTFFNSNNSHVLADNILAWLNEADQMKTTEFEPVLSATWRDSAEEIIRCLV